MNYGDQVIPCTRISKHKHFAPREVHKQTVIFKEYSRNYTEKDVLYNPFRLINEKTMLYNYIEKAKQQTRVRFSGRSQSKNQICLYWQIDMRDCQCLLKKV